MSKVIKKIVVTAQQAKEQLLSYGRKVKPEDLKDLLSRAGKIRTMLEKNEDLVRLKDDGLLLVALIRDYSKGNYRKVPFRTIASAAGALLYLLTPIDLIPDTIIGIGLVDDAAVIKACIDMIRSDLDAYRQWRDNQGDDLIPR